MSQIRSVQVLRAMAALSVVFGHLEHEALKMPTAASSGYTPVLLDLTGAGVDLFFIISGFVMVYASERLFGRADGWSIFLRRRIARIVPLYWVMTSLFLLTITLTPHMLSSEAPTAGDILKSYLFVPYVHAGESIVRPIYKLGWTLDYEMFFYCVFATMLLLPMRFAIGGIAILFLGLVSLGAVLAPAPGPLAFWSDPIILEFVMGAFIALAFLRGWRLATVHVLALFSFGFCGFGVSLMVGLDPHGAWRPVIWGFPAAAIVAAAVLQGESQLSAGRIAAFLVLLGDASYALYLTHPLAVRALRLGFDRSGLSARLSPWIFIGLGLAIVVPMALVIHLWGERPVTRVVQNILAVRPRASEAAPSYGRA